MRSGTWHVVVPNGVDVAIDQCVYFSLWPSDSDNESSQTRARARGAHLLRAIAIARVTCCASNFDIAAAIPAPAQAEIRADPSRKEALRKRYQPQAEQERRKQIAGLDRYALPPARAALRERVPKQRYDAALAAGPHALTLP